MDIDFGTLLKYEQDNLIRHGVHPTRDLHVWCYTQYTVYNGYWDDITRMARGLVTDGEGYVISRPFPKFFNWGQPEAPGPEITNQPFWAYDKEDGSLIIVSTDANGDVVVNTKGSFTTWHSEEALKMLQGWKPVPESTALFEFIHPGNRIVLDYGNHQGLILLGAVSHADGCDHFTPEMYADESGWHGNLAKPRAFHLPSMLNDVKNPENGVNREGFVIVWPNPDGPSWRVKIKFAQYLHLHHVLSKISNVAVWEALADGTFNTLLELVPDEMYDKVRECADELNGRYSNVNFGVMLSLKGVEELPDRKSQAAFITSHVDPEFRGLVFAALDKKDISDKVWKLIKPKFDNSWSFLK